eukprot:5504527-Pyramimonas_sp.AAC.1
MFLSVRKVPRTAQARMWRASHCENGGDAASARLLHSKIKQVAAPRTGAGARGLAPASELSNSVAACAQACALLQPVFGFFFFEAEESSEDEESE